MLGPALSGQFAAMQNSVPSGGGTFTGPVVFTGGLTSTGPASTAGIIATGGSGNADGGTFLGTGTGSGVNATGGATGEAAIFTADTTSPVRAALLVTPQDAEPTGAHVVGHRYVDALGSEWACIVAGTPGTWARVGPRGTATNDSAVARCVGEIISASAAVDSVGSWTTNTPKNVTSISLTAGDWDVYGQIAWAGTTVGTYLIASISPTSGTLAGDEATQGYTAEPFLSQANSRFVEMVGPYRATLAGTTTIYLVGQQGFTVGTPAVGGAIRARRMR